MGERRFETTAAFRKLMDLVRDGDAAQAMGSYALEPGAALVIDGRPPERKRRCADQSARWCDSICRDFHRK